MRLSFVLFSLVCATSGGVTPVWAATAPPQALHCESRPNPLGIDSSAPRLSWKLALAPGQRGLRQSAYQVLVASSPALLARSRGDLWDSGRAQTSQSVGVAYAGKPLASARRVYWKVRFWDERAQVSPWSQSAQWMMGLLAPRDWRAQWIAAPDAAVNAREPLGYGYHAGETTRDEEKWVQVDLGQDRPLQMVRLTPMLHAAVPGFGFPLRFKIEAATDAAFTAPTLIADQSGADFANPGIKPVEFAAGGSARYVRVTVSKMAPHPDGTHFAFALRQLEVLSGGKNVALDAPVAAKDSVENYGWVKAALTDGVLSPSGESGQSDKYPTLLLRREFTVKPGLRRAVAFVSGLGQYEMSLNGAKVGDDLLTPGWTNYRKTVLYDTRDITAALRPGANAVGLLLGNGMYNVQRGRYTKFTGSFGPQKAIAQLRLEYQDGSVQTVVSDANWRAARGPLTFCSVYGGEDYDARRVQRGWDAPRFNAASWQPVSVIAGPGGVLKGLSVSNPPIRAFETFKPVSVRQLSPSVTVYDMGQNASVMPRLTVKGPAGSTVRIIPGELLKPDGSVSQDSGGGPSYWQYTLAGTANGKGSETYFPKFFYRGSRYQQVEVSPAEGSAEPPVVQALSAVMVQAASPVTGRFSSSNELFNRIWPLVRWAQRSNMVSIMTDCPHREKLGWLEEDHLNGPALRYNFEMGALFDKIMNDMADAQTPAGMVPSIAPEYVKFGGDGDGNPFRNSPEWGSAFILVAWQQFQFNGDVGLLRRHYDGMKRYLAYLESKSSGGIVDFGLGDWFDIGPNAPGSSQLTPIALTATAIYYEDATVLAQTARLLHHDADAQKYEELSRQIAAAFNARFFNAEKGYYATNSQTANAMPLVLGLVEPAKRQGVVDAIVKDIRDRGNALTAGDVGYRYLLRALADNGRSDVIYAMNNQSEKPGYGFQLGRGATSLTEAWDANPGPSQNHFMLGQINEWFFHDLAGIQPVAPGFAQIAIKPAPVADLTQVDATYQSAYGPIRSHWTRRNGQFTLQVTIPANTSAKVTIPTSQLTSVTESGNAASKARGVRPIGIENGAAVFEVGAGSYVFAAKE